MAGHSHWKTIKRTKETEDKKRGAIFSKIAREIVIAVREKGKNIDSNPRLRAIIEKAKQYNLPKDNIEKAIKKGAGELPREGLEEIIFEAYGPGNVAIIIEVITDNKNRTLAEIKQILNQNNGKIVAEGGVRWLFEKMINRETGIFSWIAKQSIKISEEDLKACHKLFEELEENEAVQKIYYNITL
jgi:YebC/PmpR family DNA-binding regulatory protein